MSFSPTDLGRAPELDACRDAIHVAVVPAVALERLTPGQKIFVLPKEVVNFEDYDNGQLKDEFQGPGEVFYANPEESYIAEQAEGVVDPFLGGFVDIGERFWALLRPNTAGNIRHLWDHPGLHKYEERPPEVLEQEGPSSSSLPRPAAGQVQSGELKWVINGTPIPMDGVNLEISDNDATVAMANIANYIGSIGIEDYYDAIKGALFYARNGYSNNSYDEWRHDSNIAYNSNLLNKFWDGIEALYDIKTKYRECPWSFDCCV